jgi:hypothetical protein
MVDSKRALVVSIIGIILILWPISPVGADITLFASNVDSYITRGQHFSYDMDITSDQVDNSTNIIARVYGVNQTEPGDYSAQSADMDNYPYTARPFLTVSPGNFTLEPGMKKTISVEGEIPDNIGDGGRYAIIDILAEPPKDKGTISFGSAFRVPVKLTIEGSNLNRTGEITDINVGDHVSARMQNVSVAFTNTGNYHYRAIARADLVDKKGDILANAKSEMSFANILPLTSALFKLTLEPGIELGPGPYRLKVVVDRDDGTAMAEKEVEFEIKS